MQPNKDGQINIGLVGFGLQAPKTITRVLFSTRRCHGFTCGSPADPRRSPSPSWPVSAIRCTRSFVAVTADLLNSIPIPIAK